MMERQRSPLSWHLYSSQWEGEWQENPAGEGLTPRVVLTGRWRRMSPSCSQWFLVKGELSAWLPILLQNRAFLLYTSAGFY